MEKNENTDLSSPSLRAFFEIGLSVIFTFGPLLFVSIPFTTNEETATKAYIFRNFFSYLEKGEITLTLLSMSATLTALVFLNGKLFGTLYRIILIFVILPVVLYLGVLLGKNPGFKNTLQDFSTALLWVLYFIIIIFWFITIIKLNSPVVARNSTGIAKKLLLELNRKRAGEQ